VWLRARQIKRHCREVCQKYGQGFFAASGLLSGAGARAGVVLPELVEAPPEAP